jgi:type IX secretion system PorP/SprF family membrane protein
MKKKYLLSVAFFLLASPAFTQIQLTQYFLDGTLYNPAFAGSQEAICANVYGRQQWMGLADVNGNKVSPISGVFNIHAPIYAISSGLGLNVVYDKTGFEQTLGVKLNYAYRFVFKDESKSLGIGIGVSLTNKSIEFNKLIIEQPADPLLKINQKESGIIIPDFDFGILYQQINKIYAGISSTNLLEASTDVGNVSYGQQRNFYLTAGYYIKLTGKQKKALYIIPSLLVKSNLVNVQFDLTARMEYNNLFWAGASYRYQDAVAVLAGINLKGFRIGASYDITTSYLSKVSNGSVELFIGYCYTIRPKVKLNSLFNTRYL